MTDLIPADGMTEHELLFFANALEKKSEHPLARAILAKAEENGEAGQKSEITQFQAVPGNGLSGLVHISQICEKRIKKPSEVLTVGDKVKVKVTAVKDEKLSLSIKEATDMMAKEIEEEVIELPDSKEEASTSLGALFANIKLDN